MAAPAPAAFRALVEARFAALKLSKYQLAKLSGVHYNTVQRWWRDLTPTDETLGKIAPVLDVPLTELQRTVGRIGVIAPNDPEEQELQQRAEEFKAGLRGIPRPFWAAVTSALTAAGAKLAEGIPVIPPPVGGVTAPDMAAITDQRDDDGPLPIRKQDVVMLLAGAAA